MALLPNREDVLYRGGRSFNYNFTHEAAAHTSTETSGGASVSYDRTGVQLSVGGTAGDSAALALDSLAQFREGKFERNIVYQTWDTSPPYTDTYKLGYNNATDGSEGRTAYLDFKNGVYSVEGTTAPATLPGSYRGCYLKIVVDLDAGETTFTQRGDINETVTINSAGRMQECLVEAVSNGANDDPFKVTQASSAVIPPE